jgi:hypothetical protein
MRRLLCLLVLVLLVSASSQASFTVATFANPSLGSSDPLFSVNWTSGTITGGWADGKGGLDLELPNDGPTISNVWFNMSTVKINTLILTSEYGYTGPGIISFYAPGTTTNPLYEISFASGVINKFGFGSDDDVTFSGSALTKTYQDEQFGFAFAAKKAINGGFTATAAFDASAETGTIPEPASMALLALGGLLLIKRRYQK